MTRVENSKNIEKLNVLCAIDATKDNKITVGSSNDGTLALQAKIVDKDGNPATATVTWASSDNSVATVNANGIVTAVKAGNVTISATVGTSVKTYAVEVKAANAPTIESVTAINRNEIEVKFNRELSSAGANTTIGNYFVNNLALTGNDAVALDPTDASKVIITFDKAGAGVLAAAASATQLKATDAGYLDNDATYSVKVASNTLVAKDGTTLFPTAKDVPVKAVSFSDHAKPQVASASFGENGDLVVKFNEEVYVPTALNDKITYNSKIAAITTPAAAETLVSQVNSKTIKVSAATLTTITPALEAGKTYPLVINGIKDLAENTMDEYRVNLAYTATSTAPTVKSVTAKDEKTLVVEISKPLSATLSNGSTIDIYKGTTKLTPASITDVSAKYGLASNTKFEVALPTGADVVYNSALNETSVPIRVVIKNAKDSVNNLIKEYDANTTVTKDTTKPAFLSAEYTAANTIKVKVSKELAAVAINSLDYSKMLVTDKDGAAYPVTGNVAITAGDKEFTFSTTVALPSNENVHVKLLPGLFADNTLNGGNKNETIEFDVKTATTDVTAPTAVITSSNDNTNTITVTYTDVGGMTTGTAAGSITDLANYTYDNKPIPAGSTITVDAATKKIVTITFAKETITETSALALKIIGVKDAAGNLIDPNPTTTFVTITDNVKPVLQSAVVNSVNGNLELTFSEKVQGTGAGATGTIPVAADFEIYKDGVKLSAPTVVAHATDDKMIYLTPNASDSLLTGTITVKVVSSGVTGADAAANTLKSVNVTATRK